MTRRETLRRLAWREYGPLAGSAATWAFIVVWLGARESAYLLAAVIAVSALRGAVAVNGWRALRRLARQGLRPVASLRRSIWGYEAVSALGAMALVALLAFASREIVGGEVAGLLLIGAAGIPPRHVGPVMARVPPEQMGYARTLRGVCGAGLVGGALALGADAWGCMAVLAAREWLWLATLAVFAKPADRSLPEQPGPAWPLIAAAAAGAGGARLGYNLAKTLLGAFAGPAATPLARTARGLGWFKRWRIDVARARLQLALLAVAGAVLAALVIRSGAVGLLTAAAAFRLTAVCLSTLAWSLLAPPVAAVDAADDDDD